MKVDRDIFENQSRSVLSRFGYAALAPIARIFMRFGWSSPDLEALLRWIMVRVFYATPEFWQHGRPTALQGAIKTGLPRSVVKKLSEVPEPQQALFTRRQNLAYRVIEGWVNDPLFHRDGKPAPLPLRHRSGPTFNKLVMKYGNDVTLGAVLGDLQQVGCITVEDGIVTLVNQTYGLNFLDEDRLSIMGYMMKRLGETSDHNLTNPDLNERRLQRFWWQILIPAENTAEVMQRIKEEGIRYGREMDKILAEYSHIKLENNVQYVEIGFAAYVYQDLIEIEDGIPKDDLKVRSGIK